MTYQINDPEEIDWAYFWAKKLEAKKDRSKDWNKAAPNFGKSAKRDDYHTRLIERINVNKEETILDLGCGDGTITIPLAKRAKSVTGVDSAHKMLEILNEKAQQENMDNIKKAYELLADEKSKDVFCGVLNFLYSGKLSYLKAIDSDKDEVFESVLKLNDNESYLDLGAYRGDTVDELRELYNLASVTTTSPLIARFIKENFTLQTRASVNMSIGAIEGFEYVLDLFDSFYLAREYNRDLKKIKEIRSFLKSKGKGLYGLANSGCLKNCSAPNAGFIHHLPVQVLLKPYGLSSPWVQWRCWRIPS